LVDTVAFCDWEPYCQEVLKKHWPGVPVYGDIKELTHEKLKADGINKIDIITGGYPCQPFSVAGRQKAEEDPRHLWPEYFRLIKELRPTWVIGENVSGHIKLGLDTVLENLESEGYTTRTFSISASSIGANHQRERVWIIAHSSEFGRDDRIDNRKERQVSNDKEWNTEENQSERGRWISGIGQISQTMENSGRSQWPWSFEQGEDANETRKENADQFERSGSTSEPNVANTKSVSSNGREHREYTKEGDRERQVGREGSSEMADSNNERCEEQRGSIAATSEGESLRQKSQRRSSREIADWWSVEPSVGRVAHGLPKRVDRLKCLGNSVVPIIPYLIGKSILEIYE